MSCINCGENTTQFPTGDSGQPGALGPQGLFGGFSGEWIFSTSTSSGPSSTQIRFNNSTYSLVSTIYISDTNADSLNYDAFLDSLDNNSQYGYIRIFKKSDNTKFWYGKITSVTDNGTDHSIGVDYLLANSTFSSSDNIVVTFSPAGQSGSNVLYNDTGATTTYSTASYVSLMSYTIPANKLANDGDILEVTTSFYKDLASDDGKVRIEINSSVFHAAPTYIDPLTMLSTAQYMTIRLIITRTGATTISIDSTTECYGSTRYGTQGSNWFFVPNFIVSNLSLNTNLIDITGETSNASNGLTCNQLLVKYSNKI